MKLQNNEIRDIIEYFKMGKPQTDEPRRESPPTPLNKGGAKGGGINLTKAGAKGGGINLTKASAKGGGINLTKASAKGGGIFSKDDLRSRALISNGTSLPYNPNLIERAKELRKNMTPAERKLWYEVLSNKKFENLRWLRQRTIDHYITDFYCASLKLVLEVDGDSHAAQEEYDQERTRTLEGYGIKVVRFTNDDVMQNLEGVFLKLQEIVDERLKAIPPTPLNKGGKEEPPLSRGAPKAGGLSRGAPIRSCWRRVRSSKLPRTRKGL